MLRPVLLALLIGFVFAAPARADCQSKLNEATDACGCLFCPVFYVPAACCAQAGDDKEFTSFCGKLLNGGCLCWRFVGVDGPIVRAAEEPPLPPVSRSGIAY